MHKKIDYAIYTTISAKTREILQPPPTSGLLARSRWRRSETLQAKNVKLKNYGL